MLKELGLHRYNDRWSDGATEAFTGTAQQILDALKHCLAEEE